MDKEEIIRMARAAGFCAPNPHDGYMGLAYDYRDGTDTGASLERFAALVAAEKEHQIIDILERLQERSESHNYYAYAIKVIRGEI